ncbi:hypothetical protein PRZ48_013861 [Zasmidium cellare]|uniref:Cytochrome P450 n=1 Tax=Zasmidium cellare TaxID=395010 RepID=A0ABR0E289_ZASCE|nr:hypothetical protein PRZ48_013861 [Zasmidium cellare]
MPKSQSDARKDLESIIGDQASGVVSSPDVWKTIFKQNARLTFNDEVVEDAALFEECSGAVDVLLHTYSAFNAMFPWLPEPAWIRRRMARRRLVRLVRKMVDQRIRENRKNPERPDDPLQRLLDNGDPYESVVEFFVSSLFISTTNAHAIAGQMLNIMAVHPDWQQKIYDELREAIDSTKAKFVGGTMVDQLDHLPLEAWESKLPTMALCVRETIRMWTSFSVTRLNTSDQEIAIPDTHYVIPPKTFVIYNSTEVNFSEKLYPNPTEYDPSRFLEGREEFKREHFGFLGWGQGQHACMGTRWAKLQQYMIVAYAVAIYKWNSCQADGTPDPFIKHRRYLDSDSAFKLPPAYAKLERRDYIN